jgi:hypothetical protein
MSGREHLTLYFYEGEEEVFDARPTGSTRAGWVIQLATEYLEGDWTLPAMAVRGTSTPTKLSVSVPRELASELKERHPEPVSDVLRTLVLAEAGLAVSPAAAGRLASRLSVAVPASLSQDIPALEMLVRKLVRTASAGARSARVSLSRDTAEVLEKIRGDVPPAVLVSGLLARHASESEAAQREKARPAVLSCDWRPYAAVVAGTGWPANLLIAAGPLEPDAAEEVSRRLQHREAHFWIAMDAGVFVPADPAAGTLDRVAEFHLSVIAVVAKTGLRSIIAQVNMPWGSGGLVAIANVARW